MIGKIFWEHKECFDIRRTINGYNGVGGFWITEDWLWKNGKVCRSDIKSLSANESNNLEEKGTLR